MQKTVLAFGEVLWDILPTETILGGAPFNFAYRVNSLGDRAIMISRLGQDELGQKAFEEITKLDLDTSFIQWDDEHPTGTVPISFDVDMNPDFIITPDVAYDYIELTDRLIEAASDADCLCFGTLAQRNEQSRNTLAAIIEQSPKSLKILDINLRKDCYNKQTVAFSLQQSDILKLNDAEIFEVAKVFSLAGSGIPEYCQDILETWPLQYCLVTLGDKGVFAMSHQRERIYVAGYKVKLADSLGSGDAFMASFVHKLLHGESLVSACEFGNIMGAIVATQTGATVAVDQDRVDRFLAQSQERVIHQSLKHFMI